MKKKKVLLIVTGGVASYKALELMRLMVNKDYEVECILTKNTMEFINLIMFETLLGKKVFTDLFSLNETSEMSHIELASGSDLILVVPATANFIGKVANGIADDLASTVIMASNKPVYFAPGMNTNMWENKIVKGNIKRLKDSGYNFILPTHGKLACGKVGIGKLIEIEKIFGITKLLLEHDQMLRGKKAIVTAGPSIEKLDPIRFLSNFSSGFQGFNIAKELANSGAETTLISGPTNIQKPDNVKLIEVKSGEDFLRAAIRELPADIFVSVAAICDWKAKNFSKQKIKKTKVKNKSLLLEKNVDVLQEVSLSNQRPKLVIGFSAETENLLENSKKKLLEKRCDWIFGNQISKHDGFNTSDNKVSFIKNNLTENWPRMKKEKIAQKIVKEISVFFNTA